LAAVRTVSSLLLLCAFGLLWGCAEGGDVRRQGDVREGIDGGTERIDAPGGGSCDPECPDEYVCEGGDCVPESDVDGDVVPSG
jgi:hypothetical protein